MPPNNVIIEEEINSVVVDNADSATVTVTELDGGDVVVEINENSPSTIIETEPETESVTIIDIGPQGPQGEQGAPGSGGDLNYIHNQISSASTWNIAHNLGKRPSVTVVDTGDNIVTGDVIYVDDNNVQILFASAFTGKAYLN